MPTTEHEPRRPGERELLAAYDRARAAYARDPGRHTLAILETGLAILVHELYQPGKFELGQMPGADLMRFGCRYRRRTPKLGLVNACEVRTGSGNAPAC